MMDRKMVNFIKEQYPPGTRIRLNSMEDPYHPILPGTEGEVDFVDDEGQIFMKWDNGRTLPLVPGEDSFTVLLPKLTTIKLYMPLTADLYERNEYGDFDDSSTLLEGSELRGYQDQITAALVKNRMPEETERGLMHWYSRNDRTEFIHTVQETQVAQQSADISKKRRRLATAQKRAGELEKLICKIYEDNALGKLPDTRYKALDAQYAKEQDTLEIEIAELEKAVTGYEQSQKSAEKFIALIDKYENFDTLTNTMLNEFVEKILVHERARKGSQDTTQEIEIYFNFLGRYIPPSLQPVPLTPEEQEELQKKEERKDRLHQNYLKRKASGAQKRYEDKIKAKKKAEMDAKKALIRAEDMKKGVFSTVGQLPKEEPRKGSIAASAAV